jgi:hypothetical protein
MAAEKSALKVYKKGMSQFKRTRKLCELTGYHPIAYKLSVINQPNSAHELDG